MSEGCNSPGDPIGDPKLGPNSRGANFCAPGKVGPRFGTQFWHEIWAQIWIKNLVPILGSVWGPTLGPHKSGPHIWDPRLESQIEANSETRAPLICPGPGHQIAPNLGPQTSEPNLAPKQKLLKTGPKFGIRIWDPHLGPHMVPKLGPKLGPHFFQWPKTWASYFWVPVWDP